MKIGSLFAGIGGFDLAAEWMGWRTIWQSEIDPYCVALLRERFPTARQLGDITAIDWSTVERPDIITGGFPCQDISYAGRGTGLAGARSGLWYEYARAIREVGPRYVVVENVAALFTRGFDAVLGTLADLGYDAEWAMYGAGDIGAPHRRHRVWILAYPNGIGSAEDPRHRQLWPGGTEQPSEDTGPAHPSQPERWWATDPADVADPHGQRGRGLWESVGGVEATGQRRAHPAPDGVTGNTRNGGDGTGPDGTGPAQPHVGRVADGIPARVHRLTGLGNAIVPACALPVYRRIQGLERISTPTEEGETHATDV